MFLKRIRLTNFRNYKSLEHDFNNPVTILIGNNAQGKSNFLESVYYLATSKSQKAEREDELLNSGETVLRVEGDVESAQDTTALEVAVQTLEGMMRKRVKVNGVPRRVWEYSGSLAVVLFSPEDINLVTGSPSLRRGFCDHVLSQTDRGYKKALSDYENILARKNRVLKAIRENIASVDQLVYWSQQQLLLGTQIANCRRDLFAYLNSTEKKLGDFRFEYMENPITKERLLEYQGREIDSATSLIGPHRDDFSFRLIEEDGVHRDLAKFGSRGEQRTAVLDLKLGEVSYIESKLGSRPVLILDDIFSELDLGHRKHVVSVSKLQQTIIAAVELDNELEKDFEGSEIIRVKEGSFNLLTLKPGMDTGEVIGNKDGKKSN